MDYIRIEGLELRCIVGLRSYERHREQPLRVDIRLGLDLSRAGRSGRISDTADYSRVADATTALLRFREYRLLEVAAEEAAALLFATHPSVQEVKVRLDKPEALAGRARSAAVEITRAREEFGTREDVTEFGVRIEILRSQEATIEAICLARHATVTFADPFRRLEWPTGEVTRLEPARQGPLLPGALQVTEYRADSDFARIVRCVTPAPAGPASTTVL